MKGLLLIGGAATRLLPMSKTRSKSLLPVCDVYVLTYQIRQLGEAGIHDIILATDPAKADQMYLAKALYRELDVDIKVSWEPEPYGTAGAIAHAKKYIGGDQVLVLNADILSDINLRDVLRTHAQGNKPATIVGCKVADPSRYGLLDIVTPGAGKPDEVVRFSEKPDRVQQSPAGEGGGFYINAGVYVLEQQAIRAIPEHVKVSIERETFPQLIAAYGGMTHHAYEGLWEDIGTFQGYFNANFAVIDKYIDPAGEARGGFFWKVRDELNKAGKSAYNVFDNAVYADRSVTQGPNAHTTRRVVLMEGAEVGAGSRLENCILLPGSIVGERCVVENAIIGTGVKIADQAVVQNQLLFPNEEPLGFTPAGSKD